jgi:hypothetical protein
MVPKIKIYSYFGHKVEYDPFTFDKFQNVGWDGIYRFPIFKIDDKLSVPFNKDHFEYKECKNCFKCKGYFSEYAKIKVEFTQLYVRVKDDYNYELSFEKPINDYDYFGLGGESKIDINICENCFHTYGNPYHNIKWHIQNQISLNEKQILKQLLHKQRAFRRSNFDTWNLEYRGRWEVFQREMLFEKYRPIKEEDMLPF